MIVYVAIMHACGWLAGSTVKLLAITWAALAEGYQAGRRL